MNTPFGKHSAEQPNRADSSSLLATILQQCVERNQRRLVVLSGEQAWTRREAQRIALALVHYLWVTDSDIQGSGVDINAQYVISPREYQQVLGIEARCVVVDCHNSFYPDSVAALMGCIRGGGIGILLISPLDHWEQELDQENKSRAIHGVELAQISCRFRQRIKRLLSRHEGCVIYRQGVIYHKDCADRLSIDTSGIKSCIPLIPSSEQVQAIEAVKKVYTGRSKRPLVISADRGRGKSAAFGIAAAELMSSSSVRIIITAARPDSVVAVFKHAEQMLPTAERRGLRLECLSPLEMNQSNLPSVLEFVAPDELIRSEMIADLVLVDEAAALPTPMLTALLNRFVRIAFATTVHGYEGTGRGFAIRFQQVLDRCRPQRRILYLNQPIRWSMDDPLERFISDAFLLREKSDEQTYLRKDDNDKVDRTVALNLERATIQLMNRDELAADENLLRLIFGLLTDAHYRTTPSDLRDILDGPNINLWVMTAGEIVVGVLLAASEGGFDEPTAEQVVKGKRRPRGHLLPQQLAAQLGYQRALTLRSARVVRIAVRSDCQNKMLGNQLLQVFEQWAMSEGFDYLGSSFGCTAALIRFWGRNDFIPVRVGFTREASSGQHALTVMKALSKDGHLLQREVFGRYQVLFVHQLNNCLRNLETEIVFELMQALSASTVIELSAADRNDIEAFALSARSIQACHYGMWKATLTVLCHPGVLKVLTLEQMNLLVLLFLQQHDEKVVIQCLEYKGRDELITQARHIATLIQALLS